MLPKIERFKPSSNLNLIVLEGDEIDWARRHFRRHWDVGKFGTHTILPHGNPPAIILKSTHAFKEAIEILEKKGNFKNTGEPEHQTTGRI